MKKFTRVLALAMALVMVFSLVGCSGGEETTASSESTTAATTAAEEETTEAAEGTDVAADVPADRRDASEPRSNANETQPLVFGSLTMNGKFTPFYYTGATDNDVISRTQMSLITNNENAEPVAGVEYPTVAYDFTMEVAEDNSSTTYEFVLKNGLVFSDGTPLTVKDVMFNLYVYLDPAYAGSTTLYTQDIVGLEAYRTQVPDESAAADKAEEFNAAGAERAQAVIDGTAPEEDMATAWEWVASCIASDAATLAGGYTPADLGLEASEDFATAMPNALILLYSGALTYDGSAYTLDENTGMTLEQLATASVDECVAGAAAFMQATTTVADYGTNFGFDALTDLSATFAAEAQDAYLQENAGAVKSISGITTGTKVCDDGVTRDTVTIKVNGVDPTTIWQFTIPIAPMHYYAGEENAANYNGVDNFGVVFNDQDFQNQLKIAVPMGAGPYKATDAQGSENPTEDTFFENGIVYLTANDNFCLGSPYIKNIRVKTINAGSEMDAVLTNEVHVSEPQASSELINQITSDSSYANVGYELVDYLGYGYIGFNAKNIPNINVRRALISAMDPSLTLNSYPGGLATVIYRSMSKVSWAYPEDATAYYPYDETGEASKQYFLDAGYTEQNGMIVDENGNAPTFTFTLGSDPSDHPAGAVFLKAQEVLAKIGVTVNIDVDTDYLNKLDQGIIDVWAAAWQATIDPDLFQVYYSDPAVNSATSPASYGMYDRFTNGTDEDKQILTELNTLILQGRESLNTDERKPIYAQALDKIMEFAIELPTYQRKDMFVYNKALIDESTLVSKDMVTPYKQPFDEIWNVSLLGE